MSDKREVYPTGLGEPGCRAYEIGGALGQPRLCEGNVEWTGLVLVPRRGAGKPAEAWQTFACVRHWHGLIARRRLLDRDREVQQRWGEQRARWLLPPGHPRRPGPHAPGDPYLAPAPLATGVAALDLAERARRWGVRHPPDDEATPAS